MAEDKKQTQEIKTLAEAWTGYLERVVPRNAGPIQLKQTKRNFYAGALAMLSLMSSINEDTPEEEGVKLFEALCQELKEFGDKLEAGEV